MTLLSNFGEGVDGPRNRANHYGSQSADTLVDGVTKKAFTATEREAITANTDDIAAEIATREGLISPTAVGAGVPFVDAVGHVLARLLPQYLSIMGQLYLARHGADLAIADPAGFIGARIGPDEIALSGRMRLRRDGAGWIVVDPVGHVAGRIDADGLSVGGMRISHTGDGLLVRDRLGHVLIRVDSRGGYILGQRVMDAAAFGRWLLEREAIYRPAVRPLPVWRKAAADVLFGLGRARILAIGDSNTMGWDAAGSGQHRRALSYPAALARMMPAHLNATAENYLGRALTGDSGYAAYDPRLTVGAGWGTTGPASLGGEMWRNTSTTAALQFAPAMAWDTAEVWVKLAAAGALQIGSAGDLDSHSPATGSVERLTYSRDTVSTDPLLIQRVSGAVQVIGWDCHDSARPGVSVLNAGRSGWTSGDYAAVTGDIAGIDPDLVVIQLGLNDLAQGVSPASYRASMAALITAARAAGADVVLMVSMTPDGVPAWPWPDYVAQVYDLADTLGLPVVDLTARFGSYAEAHADGFAANAFHLLSTGYGDAAVPLAHLLTL